MAKKREEYLRFMRKTNIAHFHASSPDMLMPDVSKGYVIDVAAMKMVQSEKLAEQCQGVVEYSKFGSFN